MSLTPILPLIENVAAHMELPFVSPPSLVVDPSDAWFLCQSADSKRLMIIHKVYDIGVAYCNNPNFWEIEINGFIKIPNFGDNKFFF
jgi:hypothetical protein